MLVQLTEIFTRYSKTIFCSDNPPSAIPRLPQFSRGLFPQWKEITFGKNRARKDMNKRVLIIIFFLSSCATFDSKVLDEARFASGKAYGGIGEKIKPKVFHFNDYTFVS